MSIPQFNHCTACLITGQPLSVGTLRNCQSPHGGYADLMLALSGFVSCRHLVLDGDSVWANAVH
eukprot:3786568-Amphidinium_carterae.1